jgi:hypothetical protein
MTGILAHEINTIGVGSAESKNPIPVGRFRLDYLKRTIAIVEALCECDADDVLIARSKTTNEDGTAALMIRPARGKIAAEPGREIWAMVAPKGTWEPIDQ